MTASMLVQQCLREMVANRGHLVRFKEVAQLGRGAPDAIFCPNLMHKDFNLRFGAPVPPKS